MKKTNYYYIIGVTAFSALMLLLVVAMFIGPGPRLKNSRIIKDYAEGLESLVARTEQKNNQLAEGLAAADCQLVWDKLDQLHSDAAVLWFQMGASYGSILTSEVLLDKTTADLPESIERNSSKIERLMNERAEMIKQKLVDCLNR